MGIDCLSPLCTEIYFRGNSHCCAAPGIFSYLPDRYPAERGRVWCVTEDRKVAKQALLELFSTEHFFLEENIQHEELLTLANASAVVAWKSLLDRIACSERTPQKNSGICFKNYGRGFTFQSWTDFYHHQTNERFCEKSAAPDHRYYFLLENE